MRWGRSPLFAIGSVRAAVTVGRKRRTCPVIFRRAGRTNTSKEIMAAAGCRECKDRLPLQDGEGERFSGLHVDLPELDFASQRDDRLFHAVPVADRNPPGGDKEVSPNPLTDPVADLFHLVLDDSQQDRIPPVSATCAAML